MKKILSFMLFVAFVFSGLGSASAGGYKVYESEKLGFQIGYPSLFLGKDLTLEVKEEGNKVTLVKDGEYVVEEFFVYDIKGKSIGDFLKDEIGENCGDYSLPQSEENIFIVRDTYNIIMEGEINEGMGCNAFIAKYSPILEKIIIVPPMQDCVLEEEDGSCLLDDINRNISFLNTSLSSELELKVEDIFKAFSQKIDQKYSGDKQVDFYYRLTEMIDKIKVEKRGDKYLLFDYLSDISYRKYGSLIADPYPRTK